MIRHRPVGLLVLLAALLLSGCRVGASAAEQEESFCPYERVRVDGTPLRKFLLERTHVIACADELTLEAIRARKVSWGTAACVAGDGYLLTASHTLEGRGRAFLILGGRVEGKSLQLVFEPLRVVWAGERAAGLDLALLKAELSLRPFEWAEPGAVASGTTLVSVGLDERKIPEGSKLGRVLRTLAAGQALAAPVAETREGVPLTLVGHDVPIKRGDSGGPLATLDGRLAGLNLAFWWPSQEAESVLPAREWVDELIEEDRLDPATEERLHEEER